MVHSVRCCGTKADGGHCRRKSSKDSAPWACPDHENEEECSYSDESGKCLHRVNIRFHKSLCFLHGIAEGCERSESDFDDDPPAKRFQDSARAKRTRDETEVDRLHKQIEKLKRSIKNDQELYEQTQAELDHAVSRDAKSKAEVTELRRELGKARTNLTELEQELSHNITREHLDKITELFVRATVKWEDKLRYVARRMHAALKENSELREQLDRCDQSAKEARSTAEDLLSPEQMGACLDEVDKGFDDIIDNPDSAPSKARELMALLGFSESE